MLNGNSPIKMPHDLTNFLNEEHPSGTAAFIIPFFLLVWDV